MSDEKRAWLKEQGLPNHEQRIAAGEHPSGAVAEPDEVVVGISDDTEEE